MTTKEEYEKAVKNIKDAFYAKSVNSVLATENFKTNLDFLSGLVNERFEEKQETNYEHYKDEIIELFSEELAILNGKIRRCCGIPCSECGFVNENGDCIGRYRIKEWLKKPYQKQTFKLTQFEYDLILTYRGCHESCKFSEFKQLIELKDKGYFKCVGYDTEIHDVLEACEANEDETNC